MRRYLQMLYTATGTLGGVFMVLLGISVLYSLAPSIGLWLKDSFGLPNIFNYVARAADDFAGYSMAASAFLALAATFGHGEHIRVSLILQRFEGRARRVLEVWCLLCGSFISGYMSWYFVRHCYDSWKFGAVSNGSLIIPLWLPELGLAIGTTVLLIAIVEQLVVVARGGPILSEIAAEDAHIER